MEDGVHCIVLSTPRGHRAPWPTLAPSAARREGAIQVVRGAGGEQGEGARHVRLLERKILFNFFILLLRKAVVHNFIVRSEKKG